MPAPELAVVVVNFNAGAYLEACISSVLASAADAEVEVVVVDNGSTDGSGPAVVAAHPEVRLIEQDNRGFAAGVNTGIRSTSAPFVFALNPDAEIFEGTLGRFVKLAEERPRAGAIGPLIRNSDGTVYESGRDVPSILTAVGHAFLGPFVPGNRFTRAYRQTDWDRASEREVAWISGSAMLLRRKALDEIGLLDERFFLYAEEVDLFKRLRDGGWSVLYTPELEVVHEGGAIIGRSRWAHLQHSKSVYLYFEKHHAWGWRRAWLPFAWLALRARAELVSLRDRMKGGA